MEKSPARRHPLATVPVAATDTTLSHQPPSSLTNLSATLDEFSGPHLAASALDEPLSQSSTVSLKIWGDLVVLHPQFSHGFKKGRQLMDCPSHNIREGGIALPAIYIFPQVF